MSEGWPLVPLGHLLVRVKDDVRIDDSKTYSRLTIRMNGNGIVLRDRVEGRAIGTKRQFVARSDQLILSKIDARNGAFGILPDDCDNAIITGNFWAFDFNTERLDPKFFAYFTRTQLLVDFCVRASEGTTNRRYLQEQKFLAQMISLPPIDGQRRLGTRLDALAAKIHEAQRLRHLAAAEAARLQSARLTEVMGDSLHSWVHSSGGDVILAMDAGWSPQCTDQPARDGEWGILKTTAVQWCEFRPSENKALPPTLEPVPRYSVQEGDVLVTRAGPRQRVGVVAAVRKSYPRLMISDKLIRLRPDTTMVSPRFLELCLASPLAQEHLFSRKTGLADAQVNISQAILHATPVAYPSLEEQGRIVQEVDVLQAKIGGLQTVQRQSEAELSALLPSVLDRAFKGEL